MTSHPSSQLDPTTPFTDSASTAFHHASEYVSEYVSEYASDYVKLRRHGAFALSPDGTRWVAAASELNADKTQYVTAVWDVDLAGSAWARCLTRSAPAHAPLRSAAARGAAEVVAKQLKLQLLARGIGCFNLGRGRGVASLGEPKCGVILRKGVAPKAALSAEAERAR